MGVSECVPPVEDDQEWKRIARKIADYIDDCHAIDGQSTRTRKKALVNDLKASDFIAAAQAFIDEMIAEPVSPRQLRAFFVTELKSRVTIPKSFSAEFWIHDVEETLEDCQPISRLAAYRAMRHAGRHERFMPSAGELVQYLQQAQIELECVRNQLQLLAEKVDEYINECGLRI